MSREDLATRVLAWLLERGASGWIEAGGPSRLELCEQWRNVAAEYGADSPPAIGSLLALVREAFGAEAWFQPSPSRNAKIEGWMVIVYGHAIVSRGITLAEALISALEAAPQ